MEPSLFSFLTRKVTTFVISVGSMFLSPVDGVNAKIEFSNIQVNEGQLVFSCNLSNWTTDELLEIFRLGEPMHIYFHYNLFDGDNFTILTYGEEYHSIQYSLLDKVYDVYQSEHKYFYRELTLDYALEKMGSIINFEVTDIQELFEKKNYFIEIKAWLGTIKISGHEPINLLMYWNNVTPIKMSSMFTPLDLTQ